MCPPIAIVYIHSYHVVNMIHAPYVWVFIMFILGAFIECENRSDFQIGASTLGVIVSI